MRLLALLAMLSLAGCGAPAAPAGTGHPAAAGAPRAGLKLRHQILARYGGEEQVFEGYMILAGDSLVVRAFAGPGIDLFTVIRRGAEHEERAHVPGLADRIDLAAVGADIARCYLAGCPRPGGEAGAGPAACAFYGEPLFEERDGDGRLESRVFPEAHGIGLRVRYSGYRDFGGRELAGRISLEWGSGASSLVIVLSEAAVVEDADPSLFRP
jgi:hypothetical protein